MPFVRVVVTSDGLTREKKAELVRRTTAALVDVLDKNAETTHVVIEDRPPDSWGIAGELVDVRRTRGGARAEPTRLGVALAETFGVRARDRRDEARAPDASGARAALETFYYAFNQRSVEALEAVWAPDESVLLSNPVGGVLSGISDIKMLYGRIFEGPARIWVEYYDVTEYVAGGHALFVGRERGEFKVKGKTVSLAIRTSRYFRQISGLGWRQVHHHGSIDDAELLRAYQAAINGCP